MAILLFLVSTAAAQPEAGRVEWPRQYYAPYLYMGGYPAYLLAYTAETTGVRFFSLGFILNGGGECQARWLGSAALDMFNLPRDLDNLRALGGDVIVSFGGAGGDELAMTCPDVASLTAEYQRVIDTLNVTHLDFDIEGDDIHDADSLERRSEAIANLQAAATEAGKPLVVSFTLPVEPTGLTEDGLAVLELALASGVQVDVVNIMTMNFGDEFPHDQMGQNTIQAAESLFTQLQDLFPDKTDEQLWAMIGLTPMIGVNDRARQIFTLEDAEAVVAFAQERGIGRLAMWALNRDEECISGVQIAALNCSGTTQDEFAFSMIFNRVTG